MPAQLKTDQSGCQVVLDAGRLQLVGVLQELNELLTDGKETRNGAQGLKVGKKSNSVSDNTLVYKNLLRIYLRYRADPNHKI